MSQAQTIIEAGSQEWRAERKLGIGGSDCAAALGMSKWKTPFDLYQEKIGASEPEDENWAMSQGKAMEPLLRQHYADTTGREVLLPTLVLIHPKHAFMRYNPDGLSADGRLQEFKTAAYGKEWGEQGSDEIPQEYLLQVQHGMIVTGRDVTDVTVSIMGGKPKYFVVEADKELQEMIIDREAQFWQHVIDGTAPDPINNADVAKIYSRVNGLSITADPEIRELAHALRGVRNMIKQADEAKEKLEVQIKSFMGEHEILVDENMIPIITWKQQKGSRRIDADSLRDNYPDAAEACTVIGDPVRKFLVK